jgi:hypothetical protein
MNGSRATGSGRGRISVTMGVLTVVKDRDPGPPPRYMARKEQDARQRTWGVSHGKAEMHQIDAVPRRVALHNPDTTRFFVGCASIGLMGVRIVGTVLLCILDASGLLGGKPIP